MISRRTTLMPWSTFGVHFAWNAPLTHPCSDRSRHAVCKRGIQIFQANFIILRRSSVVALTKMLKSTDSAFVGVDNN